MKIDPTEKSFAEIVALYMYEPREIDWRAWSREIAHKHINGPINTVSMPAEEAIILNACRVELLQRDGEWECPFEHTWGEWYERVDGQWARDCSVRGCIGRDISAMEPTP